MSSNGEQSVYLNSKKAQTEQRVILYLDESACYLLPLLGLTWAPCGQTPVLRQQAGREHLNLIAAIAPNGRIYVAGQNQPFCNEDIAWFLEKLCSRYRKKDLLVIWDNASIHSGDAIRALLKDRPGRIHLERLPAYSPDRTAEAAKPHRVSVELSKAEPEKPGLSFVKRFDGSCFRPS